jgi:hypothetical protein
MDPARINSYFSLYVVNYSLPLKNVSNGSCGSNGDVYFEIQEKTLLTGD